MERHPDLSSGKGTLRLRPAEAEMISDDQLRAVIDGALRECNAGKNAGAPSALTAILRLVEVPHS